VHDERGRVGGLTNLIFLRACTGQIASAREAGELALGPARQLGYGLLEASALENLGNVEAAAGNYSRAIELAEASFDVRSNSESQVWSSKTLADVAIWHAALGNLPAARDAVRRMLEDDDAIMRGAEWPAYCYWAAAQIFHLGGESREASRALDRARRLMQKSAAELEPEDRDRFLSIPWHADLAQAAAADVWPDPPR
jgi:tetratricopeptide (TPR) repeat protein